MSSLQLEDIIKNSLANYEARYDSNDWSRMENLLGTTPDSRPFNWKPVLIVVAVLVVVGGAYALFSTLDFSKSTEKPAVYTPTRVVKKQSVQPVQKQVPPPVVTPIINEDSLRQAEEEMNIAKENEAERNQEVVSKEPEVKKEKKELSKEEIELRRARRRAMATADSNKTNEESKTNETSKDTAENVVKETKEHHKKEKTKTSSVGFNIFSTLNADSLKKAQERLKNNDSLNK